MIVSIIECDSLSHIQIQLDAVKKCAATNVIECRLDYFAPEHIENSIPAIVRLIKSYDYPWILTLRKKSQGGFYADHEAARIATLLHCCEYNPNFVDIEYDVAESVLLEIKRRFPAIKIIRSYHNFNDTPQGLLSILQSMQHPACDSYKMATYAHDSIDALRMLQFLYEHANKHSLTGIAMGEAGKITRLLGPIVGSHFSYVSSFACAFVSGKTDGFSSAPGLMSLEELENTYHFSRLNRDTAIYLLLGDPIEQSVGHHLHNRAFRYLNQNAVYVKLQLPFNLFEKAWPLLQSLPIAGGSITMPLKERVFEEILVEDKRTRQIKAINTLVVDHNKYQGFNTDGIGALQALTNCFVDRLALSGKRVLILGAGGAAHAIATELHANNMHIYIANRTQTRAKLLAATLHCDFVALENINSVHYDVLINTTPVNIMHESDFRPHKVVMDIVYQPVMTDFLRAASKKDCLCIPGYQMYVYQAIAQLKLWFPTSVKQHLQDLEQLFLTFFANADT